MCYICSQVLQVDARGNKYWHFSGHVGSGVGAVCPLWNNAAGDGKENQGNTEYNIRQIFKEFNIIMEQNRDKKLRDLVYKRIVENFKGEKAAELYNLYSTALGVKYYLLDVWKLENTMKWKIMSVKF
jgi:hypothetical protein